MHEPLRQMNWKNTDRRIAEITSVPAAMHAAVFGTGIEGAAKLMRESFAERSGTTILESDEDMIIDEILAKDIRLTNTTKTVGQMLESIRDNTTEDNSEQRYFIQVLNQFGIGVKHDEGLVGPMHVFFHPKTVTSKVMSPKSSGKDIRLVLQRMKPCDPNSRHIINGKHVRGIKMPVENVLGTKSDGNVFGDEF